MQQDSPIQQRKGAPGTFTETILVPDIASANVVRCNDHLLYRSSEEWPQGAAIIEQRFRSELILHPVRT